MSKTSKSSISLVLSLLLFFGLTNRSFAAPSVSSVSGTISHGQTITVSGSQFGTKSPALPLWWDDGEGATLNNSGIMRSGEMTWVTSGILSGTEKNYNDASPFVTSCVPAEDAMQYKATPYEGVSSPHPRNHNVLTGEHSIECECVGGTPAQGVYMNVSDQNTHPTWYIHYYQRLHPNWPAQTAGNWKFLTWEREPNYTAYHGTNWAYDNWDGCGANSKAPGCGDNSAAFGRIYMSTDIATCPNQSPSWGDPWIPVGNRTLYGSPVTGWQTWEHLYHNGGSHATDVFKLLINNIAAVDISLDNDCQLNSEAHASNVGGVTIGGFWRTQECGGGEYYGENARRFYADVYVDTTFSRAMLCDNATYSSATVCEPQIPQTWSAGSLTAEVNLGALPGSGTAYLFIFDSNNDHNATGYPVMLGGGGGDTTPPAAPSGLSVV